MCKLFTYMTVICTMVCTSPVLADSNETGVWVSQLSERSGLPAEAISDMLSNCDATQQSMYFCAWRDLLEAEQKLDILVANPENASSHCRKTIKHDLSQWRKQRDADCKAQALQEFGEGSMGPTADVMCRAQATQDQWVQMKARAGRPCTKP